MAFPLVMYGCESWTIKKVECEKIDAFELWCWKRLLQVSWTSRRSNQSILKEISPEYSLEGLMLKLKCQYFGHLMWTADSLEKLKVGGEGDNRGWDDWMASLTGWPWIWVISGSWWSTGRPVVLDTTEQLNWTEWLWYTFQICGLNYGEKFMLYTFFRKGVRVLNHTNHDVI